jgi:hypothetical protein
MFHAEYSSGQPLRMLVDLRASVDDALQAKTSKARAAAAGASASSGSHDAAQPEFEISMDPEEHGGGER